MHKYFWLIILFACTSAQAQTRTLVKNQTTDVSRARVYFTNPTNTYAGAQFADSTNPATIYAAAGGLNVSTGLFLLSDTNLYFVIDGRTNPVSGTGVIYVEHDPLSLHINGDNSPTSGVSWGQQTLSGVNTFTLTNASYTVKLGQGSYAGEFDNGPLSTYRGHIASGTFGGSFQGAHADIYVATEYWALKSLVGSNQFIGQVQINSNVDFQASGAIIVGAFTTNAPGDGDIARYNATTKRWYSAIPLLPSVVATQVWSAAQYPLAAMTAVVATQVWDSAQYPLSALSSVVATQVWDSAQYPLSALSSVVATQVWSSAQYPLSALSSVVATQVWDSAQYPSWAANPASGIVNFGGFRGTNAGTPTAAADLATKGYVDGLALTKTIDFAIYTPAAASGSNRYARLRFLDVPITISRVRVDANVNNITQPFAFARDTDYANATAPTTVGTLTITNAYSRDVSGLSWSVPGTNYLLLDLPTATTPGEIGGTLWYTED